VSRDDNDALEVAQATARALDGRLDVVLATIAGLELQRGLLEARRSGLEHKRQALAARLDARAGDGLRSMAGFCVGAALARLGWELKPQLVAEERVLLGVVLLATSLALYVVRTHGFRLGLWR